MNMPDAVVVMNMGEALKLEPGRVYVIECQQRLDQEAMLRLRDQFGNLAERHGVHFIVLDYGLKIARDRVEPVKTHAARAEDLPKILVLVGNRREFVKFFAPTLNPSRVWESTGRAITDNAVYQAVVSMDGLDGCNHIDVLTYGTWDRVFSQDDLKRLKAQAVMNVQRQNAHA